MTTTKKTSRLLSFSELGSLKGIRYSRSSIARLMKAGTFPQGVRLSSSRIAWPEAEIDHWVASLERGHCDKPGKREDVQ